MDRDRLTRFVPLLLFVFVIGYGRQKPLTVAEVIQNAERLDAKTIRVRGMAYLWVDPFQAEMWMSGGCAVDPDGTLSKQGNVVGWLTLYDSAYPANWGGDDAPRDVTGVTISEAAFHCGGDYCKITCSPLEVVAQRMYEFVGTLRVNESSKLILENIDLDRSSQLVDSRWIAISDGTFDVVFP